MIAEAKTNTERTKIFISYSRRDGGEFAENLLRALKTDGFEAYLDKHDIEKGEEWEERLRSLILAADTVIFIITPGSIRSERCSWEVDRTVELGKRLIPVHWIDVPEAEVPTRLKRLNYTFFSEGKPFEQPLSELTRAIRQDLSWNDGLL